jgi:hypothetical protein
MVILFLMDHAKQKNYVGLLNYCHGIATYPVETLGIVLLEKWIFYVAYSMNVFLLYLIKQQLYFNLYYFFCLNFYVYCVWYISLWSNSWINYLVFDAICKFQELNYSR